MGPLEDSGEFPFTNIAQYMSLPQGVVDRVLRHCWESPVTMTGFIRPADPLKDIGNTYAYDYFTTEVSVCGDGLLLRAHLLTPTGREITHTSWIVTQHADGQARISLRTRVRNSSSRDIVSPQYGVDCAHSLLTSLALLDATLSEHPVLVGEFAWDL
jgi:hypothetical protein